MKASTSFIIIAGSRFLCNGEGALRLPLQESLELQRMRGMVAHHSCILRALGHIVISECCCSLCKRALFNRRVLLLLLLGSRYR